MPSCDLPVFTLIVFDMVILFNMETFEKHPIYCIANKCMGHMFGGGGGGGLCNSKFLSLDSNNGQ